MEYMEHEIRKFNTNSMKKEASLDREGSNLNYIAYL